MAGYYGEEKFTGPHRDTQFDTQILEPPVRVTGDRSGGGGGGGEALSAGYYPPTAPAEASSYIAAAPIPDRSGGQTPINSALETQSKVEGDSNSGRRMPTSLVITSLVFRAATVVSLIVGLAVLASMSYTTVVNVDTTLIEYEYTYNFSSFSSTKYALAAAIIGAAYSILATVSVAVRLAMGHFLLPGNVSLVTSYIGDQVIIVLILTGASAAASTFKDLHDLRDATDGTSSCDHLGDFCKQGGGAIAIIFLGFCFLAGSLVISSLCFYKRKT